MENFFSNQELKNYYKKYHRINSTPNIEYYFIALIQNDATLLYTSERSVQLTSSYVSLSENLSTK